MNKKQQIILKIVAFMMIAMLLFPPFHAAFITAPAAMGFSFILSPPQDDGRLSAIDTGMLLIELLVVCAVGGIAFVLHREQNPSGG